MNRTRTTALAAITAATLAPLAVAPATAQGPRPALATTYTAAQSVTYPYRAPGVAATITITRVADTAYSVQITGTAQTARPTVIPVRVSSGLMMATGAYPMASGHGTMALTTSGATFGFHSAYLANYRGPYTFSGSWMTVVTTAQSSRQAITVGGHAYPIGITAPATSARADGRGQRIMVTRTFEVDHSTLSSPAVVKRYFAADDDRHLDYGELAALYKSNAYRRDFRQDYTFITVTVGKDATSGELLAAINRQLPAGWGRLTSTAPQAPTGNTITRRTPVVVTTAWELNTYRGARPVKGGGAWGPRHNLAEAYTGTSNHR